MFVKRKYRLGLLPLLLLLAWPGPGRANAPQDGTGFTHVRLEPEGAPDLEIFDDLNGDGKTDILLVQSRLMSVFFNQEGTFSSRPSVRIDAPSDAIFLDVGDAGGTGAKEPVYISRRGVFRLARAREGGAYVPARIIEFENAFLPPSVEKLVFLDFLKDLTGDGLEDILVPELQRFVVFESIAGGGSRRWGEIPFRPRADFYTEELSQTGKLKEVVHIPRLFSGTAGKNRFFVLYNGTQVTILERNEEGRFDIKSDEPLFKPDSREYEEESRTYFGKNVFFEDLRNDGNHALVIADNRQGRVIFHKGGNMEKPFQRELTIRTDGWILKPVFNDMDGDGAKDLILPTIEKIGIFTILRVFFTSRFDIQYMVFLNRGEPLYPLNPDVARSVSLPLSFTAGPEGIQVRHSLIYSFDGDFNGDRINDFVVKTAPRKLGIHHGAREGGFSETPDQIIDYIPMPDCSSAVTRIHDINGDGRADLFLHQKSIKNEADSYDLYLSTR